MGNPGGTTTRARGGRRLATRLQPSPPPVTLRGSPVSNSGQGEPAAWAGACFYLVGCALLVATLVSLHLDGDGRQVVIGTLAGICAVAGTSLVLLRRMASRWVSLAAVLLGLGVVTVAASSAESLGGLVLSSFGYLWAAVYVGYFFERPAAIVLTAMMAVGVVVSLVVSGVGDPVLAGVVLVATVAAGVAVLRRLVELLEDHARRDPLTGLLNRSGLEVAVSHALARQQRDGEPLTLAVLDLDEFSKVNEQVGHFAADALLVDLAKHWRHALRPDDVVGRLGGDEFLVLLPATGAEQARRRLDQVATGAPLNWSAGVVELGDDGVEAAVARADRLLFEAKRRRRLGAGGNL